ncbi:MAG: ferrochelatase [Acidobacteria bacterium]|nr:ferrochelatase [Acidobacteriota bacterium]MYD69864.1 ferrochelatase [Acidobacteriota bacterium]
MARTGGPFDAVLLISFGGPEGPDEIRPFLRNVLRGRRIPAERIEAVAHHYEQFGGRSPITAITRRQAEGLRARLAAATPDLPVWIGMRNWHPFLDETLAGMADAGVRRALGIIMAAQHSYSSCGQYRQNVDDARRALRSAGRPDIEVAYAGDWHAHPGYVMANAERVAEARRRLPPELQRDARIVFTAHSIPQSMADACCYEAELLESAGLIAVAAGASDWALTYQSRSGRPQDPWLEPDVYDYLRVERNRGLAAVVIAPIGFVADHLEVLYDLDTEAADLCRAMDLPMQRASAANDHPAFLDLLAELTRDEWARGGRPLPLVSPDPPARVEPPPPARREHAASVQPVMTPLGTEETVGRWPDG